MKLREVIRTLHPWYRSRLASISVWPAREADGGGWVAVLTYVPSADPVPPEAARLADLVTAPYRLDLPLGNTGPALERELQALTGYADLGALALLQVHRPAAAPGAVSRGKGSTLPGWLVITHASEHERDAWLQAIHAPDDRRARPPQGWPEQRG